MKKLLSASLLLITIIFSIFFFEKKLNQKASIDSPPVVLMYHLILEEPYSQYHDMFVKPQEFEEQIKYLAENGYKTFFANEYNEACKTEKAVIITFDDGYSDNYSNAFKILKKYNIKATVFLISDYINAEGHLNENEIKEMVDSGLIYFESHTQTHTKLVFESNISNDKLNSELKNSKEKIENLTKKTVTVIAYPNGVCDKTYLDTVKLYYDIAFTTDTPKNDTGNKLLIGRIGVPRNCTLEEFADLLK